MLIDRHSCGGGSNLVSAVTLLPAEQRRIESSTIRASCGQEGIGPGPCTPITPAHSAPHERARPGESRPANPLVLSHLFDCLSGATRRRYLLESRERPVVSRRWAWACRNA